MRKSILIGSLVTAIFLVTSCGGSSSSSSTGSSSSISDVECTSLIEEIQDWEMTKQCPDEPTDSYNLIFKDDGIVIINGYAGGTWECSNSNVLLNGGTEEGTTLAYQGDDRFSYSNYGCTNEIKPNPLNP